MMATIVSAGDSVLTPRSFTPLSPWLFSIWLAVSVELFSPPDSPLFPLSREALAAVAGCSPWC